MIKIDFVSYYHLHQINGPFSYSRSHTHGGQFQLKMTQLNSRSKVINSAITFGVERMRVSGFNDGM